MDQFVESSIQAIGLQLDASVLKAHLEDLGVDNPSDVSLLTEKDFTGFLKVVQARKLLEYWTSEKDPVV